jgi:hypothetical protein
MGAGGSIAFRTYLCPLRRKRANPDPEISEDRSHGDTRDLESERCRPHAAAVATPVRTRAHCIVGREIGAVRCGYGARSAGAAHPVAPIAMPRGGKSLGRRRIYHTLTVEIAGRARARTHARARCRRENE